MPKLALSRRHRRQNNLLQCWNSPDVMMASTSTASDDGPAGRGHCGGGGGGLVRATARMVSDEDMHQSSCSASSSPYPEQDPSFSSSASEPLVRTRAQNVEHEEIMKQNKNILKRPSPSMCLTDLVAAAASYGGSSTNSPPSSSLPSPRQRPRTALFDSPGSSSLSTVHQLLSLPPLMCVSPSAPSSPKLEPASPTSPWGHFVDLVPHEELEQGNSTLDSAMEGLSVSADDGNSTRRQQVQPTTQRTGFLPTYAGHPRNASATPQSRPARCELESPYRSALLRRRPGKFCLVPPDSPDREGSGPTTSSSGSSDSLPGFVLGIPQTAASSSTRYGLYHSQPNDGDLRLLMEDARAQFDSLTMEP